jgi:hypothetical protein
MSVTGSHPQVYGANVNQMAKMQGYQRCAAADNIAVFHGREIRQVMWGKPHRKHEKMCSAVGMRCRFAKRCR